MDPTVQELQQRAGQSSTPDATPSVDGDGGGGSVLGSMSLGLTRRQVVLVVGLVLVSVAAWRLYSNRSTSTSKAAAEVERAANDEELDPQYQSEDGPVLRVDPDAATYERDGAVLDYLRETGRIGGGS